VKLDGEIGILGNGAGSSCRRSTSSTRSAAARELLRPRRRGRREGVVDALEVITADRR
jgi:succinyl-CoA synthetase beta subunit